MLKSLWDATAALRHDLGDLEKNLPKEYVRKADWDRATDAVTESIREMRDEMSRRLDDIWRELKGKADKRTGPTCAPRSPIRTSRRSPA